MSTTVTVPAVQLVMPDYVTPDVATLQPAITVNSSSGRVGHVLAVDGRWFAYSIHELDGHAQYERPVGNRAYATPQDALDALIREYTANLEPRR